MKLSEQLDLVLTPVFDREMGKRLALMRMKLKLSQGELAEKLGVKQGRISFLERGSGKSLEAPFTLAKLREVFGEDTLFILLGRNEERFAEMHIGEKYWADRWGSRMKNGRRVVR